MYVMKSLCMFITRELSEFNLSCRLYESAHTAPPDSLTEVPSAVILRRQSYSPNPTESL
jgi:hypothetical protein